MCTVQNVNICEAFVFVRHPVRLKQVTTIMERWFLTYRGDRCYLKTPWRKKTTFSRSYYGIIFGEGHLFQSVIKMNDIYSFKALWVISSLFLQVVLIYLCR